MTDKELHDKIISGFDSITIDDSVKTRIKTNLTGEKNMENRRAKTISVTHGTGHTKDTETKVKVLNKSSIVAAAAAVAVFFGGGYALSKLGKNVPVMPQSQMNETETTPEETTSQEYTDSLTDDTDNKETDIRFDANAYSIFDKFLGNSYAWDLGGEKLLIAQSCEPDNYEEDCEYNFFIYNRTENKVEGNVFRSTYSHIIIKDDYFVLITEHDKHEYSAEYMVQTIDLGSMAVINSWDIGRFEGGEHSVVNGDIFVDGDTVYGIDYVSGGIMAYSGETVRTVRDLASEEIYASGFTGDGDLMGRKNYPYKAADSEYNYLEYLKYKFPYDGEPLVVEGVDNYEAELFNSCYGSKEYHLVGNAEGEVKSFSIDWESETYNEHENIGAGFFEAWQSGSGRYIVVSNNAGQIKVLDLERDFENIFTYDTGWDRPIYLWDGRVMMDEESGDLIIRDGEKIELNFLGNEYGNFGLKSGEDAILKE